jgi:hypothetical protein
MKVDGGCYCGSIRYEAEVDPAKVIICHCTDCQKLSGSAFRTVVQTEPGTFRLLTGTPKTFVKTGESGKRREQTFCPDCGTPIYSAPVGDGPRAVGLRDGPPARSTHSQRPVLVPLIAALVAGPGHNQEKRSATDLRCGRWFWGCQRVVGGFRWRLLLATARDDYAAALRDRAPVGSNTNSMLAKDRSAPPAQRPGRPNCTCVP